VSRRLGVRIALAGALLLTIAVGAAAFPSDAETIRELQARVATLEEEVEAARDEAWAATRQAERARSAIAERSSVAGGLAMLFGGFCALWAQNTGRNPWLWFFLGLFLSVVAMVLVLYRNRPSARSAA
jgi:outer membrane murein-binding lipoprotein Lpp